MQVFTFCLNGLSSKSFAFNPLHLDIGWFHHHAEHIGPSVVDGCEEAFRVFSGANRLCDVVHLRASFGGESPKVWSELNALETVKVVFDADGFNVQFLSEQVVEFTEVGSGDNPSLRARQSLAAASVNSNSAASLSEFPHERHGPFKV